MQELDGRWSSSTGGSSASGLSVPGSGDRYGWSGSCSHATLGGWVAPIAVTAAVPEFAPEAIFAATIVCVELSAYFILLGETVPCGGLKGRLGWVWPWTLAWGGGGGSKGTTQCCGQSSGMICTTSHCS